jgi:hypothetical protein
MFGKKKDNKIGGLLIVAGLLIGIGVGMLLDKTGAVTVIGLGVGFIAAFIYATLKK